MSCQSAPDQVYIAPSHKSLPSRKLTIYSTRTKLDESQLTYQH
ncbi:unnamed protein product, partial [Staurois parvus]